jgi:hypothetical protein
LAVEQGPLKLGSLCWKTPEGKQFPVMHWLGREHKASPSAKPHTFRLGEHTPLTQVSRPTVVEHVPFKERCAPSVGKGAPLGKDEVQRLELVSHQNVESQSLSKAHPEGVVEEAVVVVVGATVVVLVVVVGCEVEVLVEVVGRVVVDVVGVVDAQAANDTFTLMDPLLSP